MDGFLWFIMGATAGLVIAGLLVTVISGRRQAAIQSRLSVEETNSAGLRASNADLEQRLAEARAAIDASARELDEARRAGEKARIETARVEADLRVATEKHEEFARGSEEARRKLDEMFKALAADVLQANQKQFLETASAHFEKAQKQIGGHLGERHTQLEEMLKPFREQLSEQQKSLKDLEVKREKAYTSIEQHVQRIAESHHSLQQETGRLVTALRRPEQRGRWGEMILRNVVEFAGMTEHCDFVEQVSVDGEGDGRLRPDMIVKLPGDGMIVVDSKVALDDYLNANEAEDEERRRECMARHASAVENHVKGLADKKYWNQFDRTPKFVVMFMPIESGLTAAMDHKPDLHQKAMESDVLIVTPTLLVGLLRTIGYGWQQEDVAANAREIAKAGATLYDRLATFTQYFEQVGKRLRQGAESYNKAVGSLESSILPAARRMKTLGTTKSDDLDEPSMIEVETRSVVKDELLLPNSSDRTSPEG
ncbi:MAG: DNA recombination protein RmuC [Phycisphaerae bacterium]|nr:DNA recombination protein RmuC [Phycisphaerae bacterium]